MCKFIERIQRVPLFNDIICIYICIQTYPACIMHKRILENTLLVIQILDHDLNSICLPT